MEGNHQLLVKAWDVHNNSSERMISFEVQNRESLSLSNVLNYPNPFTQSTNISFKTAGGHTLIQIMDTMGRVLKNLVDREYEAGNYNVVFDGSGLQPGVYYVRFQNMVVQQVRAMLKVR